jgi:hypothetical protein
MQYFLQQTPKEIRLVTLSDVSDDKVTAQMKGFRIETGTLQTWEKEDRMPAGFADRLLKNGYTAITETRYQAYLDTAKTVLLPSTAEPNGKDYTIVPWETIAQQFAPPFLNEVTEYLAEPALRNFCLYPGNTVIEGDLVIDFSEMGATAQTNSRNIIVNGNLTIKGNFDGGNDIESLPQFIYIAGDLHAHNLLLSGWLDMVVAGSGFMYQIKVEGHTHGACYSFAASDADGFPVQQIESSFTAKNGPGEYPLVDTVVPYDKDMKEYCFRFEEACSLLRRKESIFR